MAVRASKFQVLINSAFVWALVFLLLQQLIVASSTYWIAGLGEQITAGQSFTLYLILFIASLSIVYLPSSLAAIFLEKSKYVALARYLQRFRESFWNKATFRTNTKLKNERLPYLSSEGFLVFGESYGFLFDWISVILNVGFNVIALGIVLETSIIYSYLVGLVLVAIIVILFQRRIHQEASQAQEARTRLQRLFALAWDNLLIGNKYNEDLFNERLSKDQARAQSKATRSQAWNNSVSSFGMLIMMAPVLGWTATLFYQNIGNTAMLVILAATLPRQVQVLQHAYLVVFYATSWSAMKARLQNLIASTRHADGQDDPLTRVQFDQIQSYYGDNVEIFESLEDFCEWAARHPKGRLTLRGPNGSGKSTLMSLLKEQMKEKALYLPAHHELIFKNTFESSLSTGQALKSHLDEIAKDRPQDLGVLLLDEWDANLDSSAKQNLNTLVDQISRQILVIEVRHHF